MKVQYKLEDLKDNWERVRSAVMVRYPHVICVLNGRDVEVQEDTVVLRYSLRQEIFKNIAETYIGAIYEGIRSYVDRDFTLLIRMEEEDGESVSHDS